MEEKLIAVVREAGEIVLGAHDIARGIEAKEGEANFVTAYDVAVQKFLFERLAALYPDAAFIGEEDSADDTARLQHGLAFVIDPIDGTTNFIKHFRQSAISVALCRDGESVVGAVYNPYTDELYYAEKGKGATLTRAGETRAMHVSGQNLENGLVLFGTAPYYAELHDRTFAAVRTLFEHSLDIRRCGSAALDLCMIADGRGEAFFEMRLSPWDYAAAMRIVQEAGGVITTLDGSPLSLTQKSSVLAGNPTAHAEALALSL